ncbi:GYDIA family GHMP kinase [Salegentibacter chungangensis]|uniref:GYDIA family GHMP kinase n=1 Tax=Salegentibacter chungangensis TaxID=1335724 RepID=A0ABW3NM25_9FLAO
MKFYSHGKLLITGEYAVLDGAKALALPTKYGQSLEVTPGEKGKLSWQSFDKAGTTWIKAEFHIGNDIRLAIPVASERKNLLERLQHILQKANEVNPEVFSKDKGYNVTTSLNFDRDWGLGTSSTLINNIADWFQIDPYKLLNKTFGGSGYDIAAARTDQPIIFQLTPSGPSVLKTQFNPAFAEELFFVHLNRKQNSREAIAHYRNQPKENLSSLTSKISGITDQILQSESLKDFEMLLEVHETLISKSINLPKIKSELFPDYSGTIKSLGGWGGDFVLATGKDKDYFLKKGYRTIIPFHQMIL